MRNVLAWLALGLAMAAAQGCQSNGHKIVYSPPLETAYGREPQDPDKALAEQLRKGAVQMAAASDTLGSALKAAKAAARALNGEARLAAQDVVDLLDDAGESVAEASSDPPSEQDVKAMFASADDERKKRINSGNDAFRSVEIALGTLEGLEQQVDGLQSLRETLVLTLEDIAEAIEAYGGKVESEIEQGDAADKASR